MRRRLIDCGRLKRLPSKKPRITESVQGSSYLHWKLLAGWLAILLLDLLADFRFEYLYPAVMFIRSVYDSYKYQGLLFSLLFICLVMYLDLLCWTVFTGPWLFLGASSCVWLELMRNTDHSFSFSTLPIWILFLFFEVQHRIHNLPQHFLNVSRPFAAHCIGYPVVTMSFLVKHQITHTIRQRQQKQVAEENTFYFEMLQKALPLEDSKPSEEGGREKPAGGVEDATNHNREQKTEKAKVSPKALSGGGGGGGGGGRTATRSQSSGTRHRNAGGNRERSNDRTSSGKPLDQTPPLVTAGPIANGDVVRPSSAGKVHVHLPSGKKQAAVKAVPRNEPPLAPAQGEVRDKAKVAVEMLQAELKSERQARMEAESTISSLELEIKKLKADLHASCLQEEETTSRVDQLISLEKYHKMQMQRLRNESDNLQHKLVKLSTGKQQDQAAIASLEQRLKQDADIRQRVEAELREHVNSLQHLWSEEEVRELKDRLSHRERELERAGRELQQRDRVCDDLRKELAIRRASVRTLEEERAQLKASLVDETRVKIELFTALSDLRRKKQSLVEECYRKNMEIDRLRQSLAEIMAIIPAPPTTTATYTPR